VTISWLLGDLWLNYNLLFLIWLRFVVLDCYIATFLLIYAFFSFQVLKTIV
jgi:hypothetical protein